MRQLTTLFFHVSYLLKNKGLQQSQRGYNAILVAEYNLICHKCFRNLQLMRIHCFPR
ncbi:unnamed protein product, partial [Vitis vinifera]|uniref:Uncharacterized protein n=1 Tax=Vitis vinifera TaxID=29760 RepID=D7U0X9_VITVI